jgi:hypothetical protein
VKTCGDHLKGFEKKNEKDLQAQIIEFFATETDLDIQNLSLRKKLPYVHQDNLLLITNHS